MKAGAIVETNRDREENKEIRSPKILMYLDKDNKPKEQTEKDKIAPIT